MVNGLIYIVKDNFWVTWSWEEAIDHIAVASKDISIIYAENPMYKDRVLQIYIRNVAIDE